MRIDALFDINELGRMIQQGYVRQQVHPTEPLVILNYTEKAAYDHVWNAVTMKCRGLIYNSESWEVVARPMTNTTEDE